MTNSKKCVFCNQHTSIIIKNIMPYNEMEQYFYIECEKCGCRSSKIFFNKDLVSEDLVFDDAFDDARERCFKNWENAGCFLNE